MADLKALEADTREGVILVVEDHEKTRDLLTALLRYEGYTVLTAADGQEALDHLAGGACPGLILLDLNMPVLDGREFCRRVKEEPRWSGVPVIILTGEEDAQRQAASLRAQGYLRKPPEPGVLSRLARRYFEPPGPGAR